MTGADMVTVMEVFAATYGREVTEEQIAVWANVFADADPTRVAAAARVWIEEQPRFPTPADIRTTMRSMREPSRPAVGRVSERIVPPSEGIPIAYAAYCAERRRQGKPEVTYAEFRGSGWMARLAAQEEAERR